MSWAKLDDQFPDHPKVLRAGPAAAWLHVCGLCYCARLLTDGFIPEGQVRRLADIENPMELAETLVRAGLWERVPGGFQIHDYLDYNPTRERVEATRVARAEAGREGGRHSGRSRVKDEAEEAKSKQIASGVASPFASTMYEAKSNPVPDPVPDPVPESRNPESPDPVPAAASAAQSRSSTGVPAVTGAKGRAATAPREGKPPKKAATDGAWEAYRTEYLRRYGQEPLRDAQSNVMLASVLKQVGQDAAPLVATFYVRHNKAFYVGRMHDLRYLAQDAKQLHTQMLNGRQMTSRAAAEADRLQEAGQVWADVAADRKERRGLNGQA